MRSFQNCLRLVLVRTRMILVLYRSVRGCFSVPPLGGTKGFPPDCHKAPTRGMTGRDSRSRPTTKPEPEPEPQPERYGVPSAWMLWLVKALGWFDRFRCWLGKTLG